MAVKSVFDIKCFKDVKFWVENTFLKYNSLLQCSELFMFLFPSADFLQNEVFFKK